MWPPTRSVGHFSNGHVDLRRDPGSRRTKPDMRTRERVAKLRACRLLNYFPFGRKLFMGTVPGRNLARCDFVPSFSLATLLPLVQFFFCIHRLLLLQLVNRRHKLPSFFVSPLPSETNGTSGRVRVNY